MIITCENCNTSFNLDEKLLKPSGSKVRCSKCKHLFIAYPPAAEKAADIAKETPAEETPEETAGAADDAAGFEAQQETDQEDRGPDTGEPAATDEAARTEEKPESAETEDIEFDDLDLEMESEPEPEPKEAAAETQADSSLDFDLSDFEKTLELTPDSEATQDKDRVEEDLDLDLDFDLESESEADTAEGSGTEQETLGSDLDLEMESETEAEEKAAEPEALEEEELDFSDFEETVVLDSAPTVDGEAPTDGATEDLDLDLDLDLEMEEEPVEEEAMEMPSVDQEKDAEIEDLDLELDLEMEGEGDKTEAAPAEAAAEDLDLSDIEKMLEPEADAAVEAEVEKWKQQPNKEDVMEETAEIDLSDIVLDAEDAEEAEAEDVELDLDIDEAAEKKIAAAEGPAKDASDIDISEFEEFEIPEAKETAEQGFGGDDIELEFELEGETTPAGMKPMKEEIEPETVAFASPLMDSQESQEKTPEKKKAQKTKSAKKSSIGTPILIVLIVLVLAFAAVIVLDRVNITIPVVSDYVKQIPYVGQLMKTTAVQKGEIRISNITSNFVDNAKLGKLFVIRGVVTNEYPQSRRYIKVSGTLFRAGKTIASAAEVYCGNILSDADLAKMDIADINKRLSNRFGDNRANFEVKPGQNIPFMIVFSNLPEDLEEFAIEVAGSSPVQQP